MRILNLFNVNLDYIRENMSLIKSQGFDAVQISPVQESKHEDSNEWWMFYQPISFEVGNKLGSKKDLENLCIEASKNGIIVVSDAVINHLAGADDGSLNTYKDDDPELVSLKDAWKERRNIDNWDDRWQVTHLCMGLPALNPDNPLVREKIINMLNEEIDLGVTGFRFDAAKSIALPDDDASYKSDFFPVVTYCLKRPIDIIYGEVIFYDKVYTDKYAQYMKVLTNYEASRKDAEVKFVENKDSFLSNDSMGYTKNKSKEDIIREYRCLTENYPNTLFYARNSKDFDMWKSPLVCDANKVKVLK